MSDKRIVERKAGDSWERVLMRDLQIGDEFRMFEPDGEPACDSDEKNAISRAISTPMCIDEQEDRWSIQVAT